jgi:hypothetical protein
MTTTHIKPPEDLPTGRGIFRALVVPFDEPIEPPHRDSGHRFQWATVRVPADLEKVSMNLDHDTSSEVGIIVGAVKRSDGIWASIKVGLTAERLIAAGYVALSPEISEDGELVGLALAFKGRAGLPSARIVDSLPSLTSADAPTERASVPSLPPVALGNGKAPTAPEIKSPAWGQVGPQLTIWGTGGRASDVMIPKLKPPPGSFDGAPVLSQIDPEAEVERARRRFEEERAGLKAWDEWPATFLRQHRKNYQILCEQFEAERARDAAEQRRKAERARDAELKAALEAIIAPQPRRWWQWWRS